MATVGLVLKILDLIFLLLLHHLEASNGLHGTAWVFTNGLDSYKKTQLYSAAVDSITMLKIDKEINRGRFFPSTTASLLVTFCARAA